jgi:enoyl-CoA hydratase
LLSLGFHIVPLLSMSASGRTPSRSDQGLSRFISRIIDEFQKRLNLEKARIGYPPSRVWGCTTTAMWVYRLGAENAKQMLFTGDLISGKKAKEIGLIFQSVPLEELDEAVSQLTNRIKGVPKNQLMMIKMIVNQAYENMGLASTQTIATLFDGMARHSPEGIWLKKRAEEAGFKRAVAERDSGDPIPGSKK